MPRSIWSGAISFGLVNVPVRMYSAISEHDLRFHLIHESDGSRIGYQKICKEEGEPVRSPREHFRTYLQSLDVEREGLPETFVSRLARALESSDRIDCRP